MRMGFVGIVIGRNVVGAGGQDHTPLLKLQSEAGRILIGSCSGIDGLGSYPLTSNGVIPFRRSA